MISDERWLADGLAIIRDLEPDTYRDIRGKWMVYVVASLPDDGTLAETTGRHTTISRAAVERSARNQGVPVADLLAAVLTHEWEHAEHGAGEYQAVLAELSFLWRMYSSSLNGKAR